MFCVSLSTPTCPYPDNTGRVSATSQLKSPKKSKSTDWRCPYCKAKAVPPTNLMSQNARSCISAFNKPNVLGSTVVYDSICNPPF